MYCRWYRGCGRPQSAQTLVASTMADFATRCCAPECHAGAADALATFRPPASLVFWLPCGHGPHGCNDRKQLRGEKVAMRGLPTWSCSPLHTVPPLKTHSSSWTEIDALGGRDSLSGHRQRCGHDPPGCGEVLGEGFRSRSFPWQAPSQVAELGTGWKCGRAIQDQASDLCW